MGKPLSRLERLIQRYICVRIQQLVAKNKNNPILLELLLDVANEYGCEVSTGE